MQHQDSYIVVKEFTDNGKKTREVIATGVTKQGFIDAYTEKGCVMRGGENPHFEDIYSGVVYKLENHFEQGGRLNTYEDLSKEMPSVINENSTCIPIVDLALENSPAIGSNFEGTITSSNDVVDAVNYVLQQNSGLENKDLVVTLLLSQNNKVKGHLFSYRSNPIEKILEQQDFFRQVVSTLPAGIVSVVVGNTEKSNSNEWNYFSNSVAKQLSSFEIRYLDTLFYDFFGSKNRVSFAESGKMRNGGIIANSYPDLSKEMPSFVSEIDKDLSKYNKISLVKNDKICGDIPNKIERSFQAANLFYSAWNKQKIGAVEEMFVLLLTATGRIISIYKHSLGARSGTILDNTIVSAVAVQSKAKGVIVCHNHPSGNLQPSQADIKVTQNLKEALFLCGINLVDSIIITPTKNSYTSIFEKGLIMKNGGEIIYEDGGQVDRERDIEIAKTILMQLGGSNRLQMFTGAYNFVAVPYGVSFRIKNRSVNYVKIVLNAMDTYDIEFGRISGVNYKIVKELSGIYNDQLIEIFTRYTGMVLRLRKGGAIQGEENAEMVMNQNLQIRHHTEELEEILKSGKEVPAWVVSKVSRAADSMSDATHYLEGTPDKMARGGNTRIVDISKLKTYVLTYIPVFDIKRAMQFKQKAVYAESEEDAIAQLPRTAKVISIKVTSGGGRGIPQRKRGRGESQSQKIRKEIKALKEMLPFLEGKDKKQIEDEIKNLNDLLDEMDTLDEMRAEGQYADGGEVHKSANEIKKEIEAPDKMARGGNTRIVDISKLKTYVVFYFPVYSQRPQKVKRKEVYAESEKDAISQFPKKAVILAIKDASGGGRGTPQRIEELEALVNAQNRRRPSLPQQIRKEIKALKEMLPLLEGKIKKVVQDEIKNLNDTLDEMRAEGQYANGGEVYDSADGISPAIQKAFNSLQNEGYFEKEAIEYVGGIKEWNKLSATEKEIIISDIEKDWSKSTFFAEGGGVNKMAMGGEVSKQYEAIPNTTYQLKIKVYYDKGGMNYFSGGVDKRGYYLSVTPVQIERQGNNVMIESYTAFSGIKKLILEVERQSPKSAEKAKELAESSIPELKQYVLNQMIERGEIPQNMPNPEPEPMPKESNRIIFDLKDFDPNTTEVIGGDAYFEGFPNITDLGVLLEIRGDANFHNSQVQSLGKLQTIGGNAIFSGSKIQDLGNLQTIGGWAGFFNSQVQDLGNLQTIGGGANFRDSKVQSLGNLQTIGDDVHFSYSQVQNLGNLQTIGGKADFHNSQVQDLGNLQTIGGNAIFKNSQVQSLGNLQTIGGDANFEYSQVQDLGNLQTIGGNADFRNSQIQSLGNLQTIGGDADFRNSQIQSLGNLQTIGNDAEFGNRPDLKAEWENRQENPEPMPEEEEEINAEEIRAEIEALEEILGVYEGEDRQSIQEEIEILKLRLEGMGNDAQNGDNIKSWYTSTYPSDDLGEELNPDAKFSGLEENLADIYTYLGVADSVVRERVFERFSEIFNKPYEYIYDKWVKSEKFAEGGGVGFFDALPFGGEVAFETEGDYELEIDDFDDKLKTIHNQIKFDEVYGETDSYETALEFYKNGEKVASLKGTYNENSDTYDSEFLIDGYSSYINFHPYNTLGGLDLGEFNSMVENAVAESQTYSAVVSIEGYEVDGQEFRNKQNAEIGIEELKEKTNFYLVRGKRFGQGKRVENEKILRKYQKGGGVVERNNYAEGGLVRNPNKNDFKSKFEWFLENNNNPVSKGNLIKMAYENTTGVDTAIPQNLWGDVDDTYFYVYDYQNSAFGELVDLRMKLKWSNVYVDVTIVKNGEVLYKDDLPYELQNPTFHQALNYIWTNADSIEEFTIIPRAEKYAKGGEVSILVDKLYSKSKFINDDWHWELKLLELLQDNSIEAYQIYMQLNQEEKESVLQELYEMDNDMGSDGDGTLETSEENLQILLEDAKNGKKYAEGGGVEIPKNKSLRHFILNEMSAGMIANRVPYSDYATIDKIRIQAVQILNRDGDREYSLQSVSDLIQEALLEYEENKSEMNFANGGGVGSIFRKAKNFGKRTLKKGVELGKSAKQKTEDAIRQKKKEIALDILYEVKENLAEGRDEQKALEKSFAVVSDRYEKGGGIGELPPKGELTNKDNFLLKYEKKGGDYEFYIYKPETKKVSGYNQVKHICVNSDCPHKMTYEQFINYLYAELYLDDMKYANGGEIIVCPVGTQIQTLIFDKSMFNLRQAKAWAKKNNFENDFVDGKLNTLRIRQKDPAMFTEDGFRTIQLRQGVQAVIGCPKKRTIRRKK